MKKLLWGFLVVLFYLFIVNTTGAEAAVRLFGTLGYGGGATSTLVELNPDTGATIQVIGPVGYLVNGLNYDPTTNKLYGGTSVNDPNFNGLIEINMTTGAGTPVGTNYWGMGYPVAITNITVDSAGQMYGWFDPSCDCLVSIDKNTGVAAQVGPSPVGTGEYGLSFNSTDVLYLVNYDGAFYRINTGTGAATPEGSVGQTAHHGDFHPDTDLYYGLTWTIGAPRTLLRCDLAAQACTPVGEVGNLHTLAFVPCVQPPSGLVSWWPGEGNASDIIGGNNGTLQGGVTFGPGLVGRAFSFDGVDDYISVPNHGSLNPQTITVDAWFYATGISGQQFPPIVKKADANGGYAFEINQNDNQLRFWVYVSGIGWQSSAPAPISPNTWYHAAGTYDGSNIRVYVNGQPQGAPTSVTGTIAPASNPLNIGRDPSNPLRFFKGLIDEVEIYNRALSADEIAAIYNAGSAGKCRPCIAPPSGLTSWWPGDGNANDIVNGNPGTLQGGATFAPGKVGQAFSFNGGVDAVRVPASASLNVQSLTIDAWVFPKTISGLPGMPVVEWNNNEDSFGVHLWLWGTSEDIFANLVTTNNSSNTISANKKITLDTWNHIALTYDKNTGEAILYVNGGQVAQTNFGPLNLQTSYPLFIGRRPAGGNDRSFYGFIDEVEIYNRALSADEILAIYNAGGGGKCKTCTSPPSDMVSWWPGDGNANDIIGGNNGTLKGGVTFDAGKVDQAFSLDGASRVEIPNVINGLNQLTIDAWFLYTNSYNWRWIYGSGPDWTDVGAAIYANSNIIRYHFATSSGSFMDNGSTPLTLNTWYHFAMTYDGSTVKGYINGQIDFTSNITGTVSTNRQQAIGAGFWNNLEYFSGLIDEVEIFNRALSAEEIRAIYNAGLWGKCKPQGADLSITKSDSPDPVNAGATLTYTIIVSNAGPANAENVVVTDTLPTGVTFVSTSGCAESPAGGVPACSLGIIPAGSSKQYTITVTTPPSGGEINNSATVSSSTIDPNNENNTASQQTTVTAVADLSITKSDNPDPVDAGSTLTYTLNVSNAGPSAATSITVTDTLPSRVTYVSALGTGWTCNHVAGVVTCTRPSLTVGNAPPITITITTPTIGEGPAITNMATVVSSTKDNNLTNNSYTAETTVVYTITPTAGPHGSITPSKTIIVPYDANRNFTITPDAGYHIADVLVDGVSVGPVSTYTFLDVRADHTISVSFAVDVFTITATAGPNGVISPAGGVSVNYGADQTFLITPNEGYRVDRVEVDGDVVGRMREYTFTHVVANHTIHVTFKKETYTLTATAGSNGGIAPAGTTTVNYGDSQTFVITPAVGYHVADVMVDQVSVGPVTSYTFTGVNANHTISVTFARNTYTLTATAGLNGGISPAGTTTVGYGDSQTFIITPAAGYHVAEVLVDGASIGAITSYTFNGVNASHTISATFVQDTYTLTATAGLNGMIAPPGMTTLNRGDSQTYIITAAIGYQVAEVLVDGAPMGAITSYTFNDVGANHTISATFATAIYSLSVFKMGTGSGLVTTTPAGIACGEECTKDYSYATLVALTAVPSADSILTGWGGACSGAGDCSITMDQAKAVTATFSKMEACHFFDDFGTDRGWVGYEEGGWERAPALAGGGENGYPDPGVDYSASGDNYILGFAIGADYPNDLGEKSITSPPLDCSGEDKVFLKFRRYLNVEGSQSDHAKIYVSHNGEEWTQVWENPVVDLTDDRWMPVVLDISSFAANQKPVYIRFTMGPTNSLLRFSGWNIDDLRVASESIYPAEGTLGTEITITGSGFGLKPGKVLIGITPLKILDWKEGEIHARINKGIPPGVYDVTIRLGGPKGTAPIVEKEGFAVKAPEIYSVTPNDGLAGNQLTIRGKFFGTKPGKLGKVYLEHQADNKTSKKACKVLSWNMDSTSGDSEIICVVPPMMPATYDVVVDPYGEAAPATVEEDGFTLKPPES